MTSQCLLLLFVKLGSSNYFIIILIKVGIGTVFGSLITGVSRNPSLRGQLFSYAILGFALTEAIGLFGQILKS